MGENRKTDDRDGDPFADLSLGERAAIARVEASLFGGDATAHAPTRVDRYEIIDAVGRGAFGRVYRARDPNLDRVIAIKVLGEANPAADRARLLVREAKIMATVGHPNVAAVYDAGVVGEGDHARVFIAMELVDGVSLRGWLDQPRSIGDVVDVMRQAGRGLAAAHAAGVVHGDFKPENVLFGADRRVRVVDFGLARAADEAPPAGERDLDARALITATPKVAALAAEQARPRTEGQRTAATVTNAAALAAVTVTNAGTPAYMAPEQHDGRPADMQSDQFAFAVVLYEAITGQRPFGGDTLAELAAAVRAGRRRPSPQARRAPRWLLQIVDRALAIDPAQRFASMEALLAALERRPVRWGVWLAVAGAIGIAVAAGALLAAGGDQRGQRCRGAAAAMGQVWSPDQSARIEHAFAATGVGYASQSWATASGLVDDYARDWTLARVDACEATYVRGEQSDDMLDRRTSCLRERLGALSAAVDVYVKADGSVVQRAVDIAQRLPALAPCSDVTELGATVPPPTEPETRKTVDRLTDELGRAYALYSAGHWGEALELARRVASEAAPLGYAPLRATAQVWIAESLMAQGNDAEAVTAAREAFDLSIAGSDHRLTVLAASILAFGGARDPRRKEDALHWVATARSALAHIRDPELEAKLANAEGNILLTGGEATAARPAFERAVALYTAIDADHPNIGSNLSMLGIIDLQLGDPILAGRELNDALARVQRTLGKDHPEVATTLVNAALTDGARGNYLLAQERLSRALGIQQAGYGADHPYAAYTLLALGVVLTQRGSFAEAAAEYDAAEAIVTRAFGAGHPMAAQVDLAQAELAARLGDGERAVELATRGLTTLETSFGRGGSHSALAEATLAYALRAGGKPDQALTHAETALTMARAAFCADCPQLGLALREQGLAQLALGRADDAARSLADAERVLTAHRVDPLLLVEVRFGLASALVGSDRPAAIAAARRALDEFPDGADPSLRTRIEHWLDRPGG